MNRKAQSAIEFVALAGVMFFFFAVSIVYVQSLLVDFTAASKERHVEGIRDAVIQEIALASRMPAGYERVFVLPSDIQGLGYTLTIEQDTEPRRDALVIRTSGTESVTFLEYNVTGTLAAGTNSIRRTNSIVLN